MREFSPTSVVRPGADMNKREWLASRWTAAGVYAGIILIPVPLLLVKGFALSWLPVLMALGPILAGLWLFATNKLGARGKSPREAQTYRQASTVWLGRSVLVAAVIGLGSALVIVLGSGSWFSYSLLKSGGFVTYALIGLAPVVAYMTAIQRLLVKRSLGLTLIFGAGSLIAPWLWAGFAVYAANHVL